MQVSTCLLCVRRVTIKSLEWLSGTVGIHQKHSIRPLFKEIGCVQTFLLHVGSTEVQKKLALGQCPELNWPLEQEVEVGNHAISFDGHPLISEMTFNRVYEVQRITAVLDTKSTWAAVICNMVNEV